tara:strand:- start:19843 stop:20262 length:420 start_codon:yes stop_codon:yes gene_type:complete
MKIVGISGEKESGKTVVAHKFEEQGFFATSILDQVKLVAEKSFNRKDLTKEDLECIRQIGYNVSKLYWINLLLATSIPKDNKHVVIDDIQPNDIVPVMKTYFVTKNLEVKGIKGAKILRNVTTLKEFEDIVERVAISEK